MSGCRLDQPGTAALTRLQEDMEVMHQAEVAGMTGIKLAGNQTISPSLQPLDPGGLLRSWIATCQLTSWHSS
ncbi:unnamed protein product [Merluccius merluccius]